MRTLLSSQRLHPDHRHLIVGPVGVRFEGKTSRPMFCYTRRGRDGTSKRVEWTMTSLIYLYGRFSQSGIWVKASVYMFLTSANITCLILRVI